MATLRQYFDTDFSHTARLHVSLPSGEETIEASVFYDFSGYSAFIACYVPGKERELGFYLRLIQQLEFGRTRLHLSGKITLPSARQFVGHIEVNNKEDIEIRAQFLADPDWVSTKDIRSSGRFFIYSESDLLEGEVRILKEEGHKIGQDIQFRSMRHAMARAKIETPLAFISHDSRDKEAIARPVAINLQKMMCPVWYDEFSLKVGDRLRESIEKGLKECKKCILVLSPNFLSNNGWTKTEFNSIFTREILEEQRLILPIWHNVTREAVYAYSPSLLNVVGLNWAQIGEEEVCRRLYQAIMQ
ncbi:toll/interleukin-1 receptor domain-containing protein [Fimbriiglobus ruber]|uniref:toll/interleukin-1 receptor domain-containing protein n=1 Tax=Fimbriiglobus ruber TaxID=1908690 RepID=UPI000B4B1511|nr:toll/interleukin-1 receptor domain-containing protein [Fimbriiglobus ruber]